MRIWHQDRKPVTGMPDDPAISHVRDPFVSRSTAIGTPSRAPATPKASHGHRGRRLAGALTFCRELSLVDGSMVEIFDGTATPYTTRAYPTTTSRWLLRLGRMAPLRAWHLAV